MRHTGSWEPPTRNAAEQGAAPKRRQKQKGRRIAASAGKPLAVQGGGQGFSLRMQGRTTNKRIRKLLVGKLPTCASGNHAFPTRVREMRKQMGTGSSDRITTIRHDGAPPSPAFCLEIAYLYGSRAFRFTHIPAEIPSRSGCCPRRNSCSDSALLSLEWHHWEWSELLARMRWMQPV